MIESVSQKTIIIDENSNEFKTVVNKMILWQKEVGFFEGDIEKEVEEYMWRKKYFYHGCRTNFIFSNGLERSLVELCFIVPLVSICEEENESGGNQEFIQLFAIVEGEEYLLLNNREAIISLYSE